MIFPPNITYMRYLFMSVFHRPLHIIFLWNYPWILSSSFFMEMVMRVSLKLFLIGVSMNFFWLSIHGTIYIFICGIIFYFHIMMYPYDGSLLVSPLVLWDIIILVLEFHYSHVIYWYLLTLLSWSLLWTLS